MLPGRSRTSKSIRPGRGERTSTRWKLAVLLAGLLAIGCGRPEAPPNIVFILIDTLRWDVLGDNAPHLEELASGGVRFDRVIAPSSWTKTSMASILTSQTPLRHGVRGVEDALPDEPVTLAEGLAAAGYRTLGVNTNPWLTRRFRFHAGFDRYEEKPFGDATTTVNVAALDLLRENPQRPAFLYLHYMDAHAPYNPKPGFFEEPPLRVPGQTALSDVDLERAYRESGLRSPETVQRVRALYEAEVRGTDAALGELFSDLEAEGFLDGALIIVTSDHGEAFLEHGTTVHGKNYYPEVYRVPLIMKWAGRLPQGLRVESLVRSIDIAPTVFDLLGLAPPPSFEGRSMLPLDADPMPDRVALGAVGLNDYRPDQDFIGVVSRDFLYVEERRSGEIEFYDLRTDPGAQHDLGPNHPEVPRHAAHIEASSPGLPDKVELDADTRRQLEALGYLGGDGRPR